MAPCLLRFFPRLRPRSARRRGHQRDWSQTAGCADRGAERRARLVRRAVCTTVPVELQHAETDTGVVQIDSLHIDEAATARQAAATAAEVEFAELEARKNPILAANVARQNEIALMAARNRKDQADRDFKNRQGSSEATINIQRANASKSKLLADNAKRIIDSMVLKSKTVWGMYMCWGTPAVSCSYSGATVPDFQVGDMARAGQTIAQIPDTTRGK